MYSFLLFPEYLNKQANKKFVLIILSDLYFACELWIKELLIKN